MVSDTATPVGGDRPEHEFGRVMVEKCAKQLGAKIEREVDVDRTHMRIMLIVEETEE